MTVYCGTSRGSVTPVSVSTLEVCNICLNTREMAAALLQIVCRVQVKDIMPLVGNIAKVKVEHDAFVVEFRILDS